MRMTAKMVAFGFAALAACVAAGGDAGEQWKIETPGKGDTAKFAIADGVVTIDFTLTPVQERLHGWRRYRAAWADLKLAVPRKLDADAERVLFETMLPKRKDKVKVLLLPLVRDEDGEIFAFEPQPAPQLTGAKGEHGMEGKWRWLKTPSFYAGEAGAASKDVWSLESEGVDFTVGRNLTLLGFRLIVREFFGGRDPKLDAGKKPEPRTGTIHLGEYRVLGARIPYAHPFAYADTFAEKKGEYRLAAQVRNRYQALPVHEIVRSFAFDPADPASRKKRLEFPLGPDDCYWIDWQVTDVAGNVVESGSFRENAHLNPDKTPLKPVDGTKAPVLGVMRINPDHAGCGVYEANEKAEIELRTFARGKKLTIKWKTLPLQNGNVLEEGETVAECRPGEAFASVKIAPKRIAERPAYRLVAEAFDGTKRVDSQTYFFGYRNSPLGRHDRLGRTANRREYKARPYNRTTFTPKGGVSAFKTEADYLEHYRRFLDESCELATSFTYMLDLRDWEVLPGVFDTYLVDKAMDMAADRGMRMTFRMAHLDLYGKNLYRWNKYELQHAADGTRAPGHGHYGAYSVLDPMTDKTWLDGYRALYDRYRNHFAFEGYYLMQPGGEWTVADQPWDGTFTGYDKASVAAFRAWLKRRYGTIAELNAQWKKNYADFGGIEAPLPDFRGGAKPDCRGEWIDFCRFKASFGAEWMKISLDSIRSYDDDRITIAYGNPREIVENVGSKLDYCHNGGNHSKAWLWEFIDAWKTHRVGWISEPHHPHAWSAYGDPTNMGWVLDRTTWVMTAQAAGGGANIHVYYFPWKTLDRLDFWGAIQSLDRFEAFKPILNEIHQMEVIRPESPVAFAADPMTLWTKHRTTFEARLTDLRLSRELFDQDLVPYGNFIPERIGEYKLVMPNLLDETLTKENFGQYVKAVKEHGAKMIISARTGSYVPELAGDEPFQLLKAFGIEPPESAFCLKGEAVEAECGKDAILFGEGKKFAFQTVDRLRAQLRDPGIQQNFWQYRFRWLPETDYFGYYPGVKTNGRVLAKFADGGAAMTMHKAGKGEVIVFWGLPDYHGDNLKGMMSAAAKWAGYENPMAANEVRDVIEGENRAKNRHYLLLWKDEYGDYTVRAQHIPDGTWFADDMVTGQRLGLFDGKTLREKGIRLNWAEGYSHLKYVRFLLHKEWFKDKAGAWAHNFRDETK